MSDKAGLMKQGRLLTPLLIVLQRAQLHLQRFCLYPPLLLCLLTHCPRLELLLYIFRLLTVQILTKGVAAPPLRLTSGVAVLMIHDGLLLGMSCNPLNHDNGNHYSNNRTKRHIHHSSSVSSVASRQPYVLGARRSALASCQLPPCPVDVPPSVAKTTYIPSKAWVDVTVTVTHWLKGRPPTRASC